MSQTDYTLFHDDLAKELNRAVSFVQKGSMSYSDILAEDKCLIVVRPSLVKISGSFLGAAILGQVIYWWKKSGNQPFYKFKEPCKHEKYTEGDSWAEELAISTEQFDTAMKRLIATGLVSAKVNASRLTFYTLNESELEAKAAAFYVKRDSRFTKNELPGLSAPALEDISKTETTSDIKLPKIFLAPTPEEVEAYSEAQGFKIDGVKFCGYYDSNGWMVGKTRMKSWKGAVATWIQTAKGRNEQPYQAQTSESHSKADREAYIEANVFTGETYIDLDGKVQKVKAHNLEWLPDGTRNPYYCAF